MPHYSNPLRATAESLAERLEQLTDRLASLGERLREGIAQAVGGTAADTARAAVRALLDLVIGPAPVDPPWPPRRVDRSWDGYEPDPWAEEGWPDDSTPEVAPLPKSRPWTDPGRWGLALVTAWQAASGLWHQGRKMPALLAAGAGLAAGLLAAPGGTAVAAGAAAAAAALALLSADEWTRRAIGALQRWLMPL